MAYGIQVNGRDIEVQLLGRRPELAVRIGDARHEVVAASGAGAEFALTVGGVAYHGWRCTVADTVQVRLNGRTYAVHFTGRRQQAASAVGQDEVRASMPGVVVGVHCEPGQPVEHGDRLLTLESMKLQMTIVAPHAATVGQVHVAAEEVFERGALLVSLVQEGREI